MLGFTRHNVPMVGPKAHEPFGSRLIHVATIRALSRWPVGGDEIHACSLFPARLTYRSAAARPLAVRRVRRMDGVVGRMQGRHRDMRTIRRREPIARADATKPPEEIAQRPHVIVVSSVRLFREGLAGLVLRAECSRSVHVARDLPEVVSLVSELTPSLVLVDATDVTSPDTARRLSRTESVIALIAFASSDDLDSRLILAESGVIGYVSRDGSVDDLIGVVDAACRGELVCSPRLAGALAQRLARVAAGDQEVERRAARLTYRERDLVRLVDEGKSNKEIARELNIELATVKNHIHRILSKLGVRRRGEAAALLRRWTMSTRTSFPDRPRLLPAPKAPAGRVRALQ
jgi:two-component system nitrate/nitrite response regulator NarL